MSKFINLDEAADKLNEIFSEKEMLCIAIALDEIPTIELPPCNTGDTIYEPFLDKVMLYTIDEIRISSTGVFLSVMGDRDKPISFNAELIGKSIFLTYEEAEKHLKQAKEEE